MLQNPVVLYLRAQDPIATLHPPPLFKNPAKKPTAVFLKPKSAVPVHFRAPSPTAVLKQPRFTTFAMYCRAPTPIAVVPVQLLAPRPTHIPFTELLSRVAIYLDSNINVLLSKYSTFSKSC